MPLGADTSYNTALPKLAKMNVIMTLRQCLGRYMKPLGKNVEFMEGDGK
jgi:hypothetical protein